jgi:membrane-bound lytic murein transglycosylase
VRVKTPDMHQYFKHNHAISMRLLKQKCLKRRMDIAYTALILATFAAFPIHAADTAGINALIDRVQATKDARFVRNGTEYSAANAAQFLRRKWQAQCKDAQTVQAFIESCASKSSTTGQPYQIKVGGKTRLAAEVLRELAAQDKPGSATP